MAPRANWRGYLRLSLVSCPFLLYFATSDAEKIRFNQINKAPGHRIKMQKVDADTGDVVDAAEIVKGDKAGDGYIEITGEDLEAVEVESTHIINVDQFVPRAEIDDLYVDRPYYIVPDGKVGLQAFSVIRDAIKKKSMAATGRVVLSTREHVIALEARDTASACCCTTGTRCASRRSISVSTRPATSSTPWLGISIRKSSTTATRTSCAISSRR
jgi:DNA end-binding protein Ku